jgi:hypothetical protein
MKTINTKRVGDSFVPDMDPYSEYSHPEPVTQTHEPINNEISDEQIVQPIDKNQAMKNFNEFLDGVDTMANVMTELLKRFR